jgi:hypothetical protein
MALQARSLDQLVTIARAGGGMVLDVGNMQTDELIRIVALAKKNVRFELHGMAGRQTQELVRIAAAGGGSVIFCS